MFPFTQYPILPFPLLQSLSLSQYSYHNQFQPSSFPSHSTLSLLHSPDSSINIFYSAQFPTSNSQQDQLLSKVSQQTHQILKMQEELYYFKTQFFRLAKESHQLIQAIKEVQQTNAKLLVEIQQQRMGLKEQAMKREEIQLKNQLLGQQIESLNRELCSLTNNKHDIYLSNDQLKDQLRSQEKTILQLSSKNQKIMRINHLLKEELKMAENKLIQLETQLHQSCFIGLSQNWLHLKENENISNKAKPRQPDLLGLRFQPREEGDTIKLVSSRESPPKEREHLRRVVFLEKQKKGLPPRLQDKLKPLDQPKPERKSYRAVDIQQVKKLKRNILQQEFYS